MLTNTKDSYGAVTKFLHWTVTILVFGVLFAGLYMTDLPDEDPNKYFIYDMHQAVGLIVLSLSILLILWRWGNTLPEFPNDMSSFFKHLSKFVHYSLYILLLLMPISGLVMELYAGFSIDFFGLFQIPAMTDKNANLASLAHSVHINLVNFWIIFLTLHILGALYHLVIKRDRVLQRILPWGKA